MKRVFVGLVATSMFVFFWGTQVNAHTPLLFIEENEDGTICLEGEFSDGSSAAGVKILIVEDKPYQDSKKAELYKGKKILKKTRLDKNGELTVNKPKGPYLIIFDAGPGHIVEKRGPLLKAMTESPSEFKLSPLVLTDKGKKVEISTEEIGGCVCRLGAFRATKLGIAKVWEGEIPERKDIKIISRLPTPCSINCLQHITGSDFHLILPDGVKIKDLSPENISRFSQGINLDNWNFTITRKSTNETIKVQIKKDVFPEDFFQLRKKVKGKGMLTRKEISEFKAMLKKVKEKFLTEQDCTLFEVIF